METQTQLVASNVRAEMARRRVTQTRLARALGKTQQTVSHKLSGQTPITVDELAIVAGVLGVAPADLLSRPVPAGSAS